MTGTSPHLDEEQLSALIDGEGADGQFEHLSACPECTARLSAWREVVARIGAQPVAPPADAREAAVSAALAEARAGAAVVDLDRARQRRRRVTRLSSAAAVALVLAGLGFGLSQIGGNSHPGQTSAGSANLGQNVPQANAAGSGSASSGASAGVSASPLQFLGNFSDTNSLVRVLRGSTPSSYKASQTSTTVDGCDARAAAAAGLHHQVTPVRQVSIIYQGRLSIVSVFSTSRGHTAVVVTVGACAVEATAAFP